jgi:hypothetical protein
MPGWDITGEPWSQVPTKSFDLRRNTCQDLPFSCYIQANTMKWNYFLWKEIIFCTMNCVMYKRMSFCHYKWFLVKGNDFRPKEIVPANLLLKDMFSCNWKWFPVKGLISCQRKWFLVRGNDFLSNEIKLCQYGSAFRRQ